MLHVKSLNGLVQNLTSLRDLRLSYVQISFPEITNFTTLQVK